jgi:hypothetical protein
MKPSFKKILYFFFSMLLLSGCAGMKEVATEGPDIEDISAGLPIEGLWRQNVAAADMNGDGFMDIIAPPQRKAPEDMKRPSIFLWEPKTGEWTEGNFDFPKTEGYDYGGIAAGDLNGDGYTDIVLAVHTGKIITLLNDKKGGFSDAPFPQAEGFSSRAVAIEDINGDGLKDIAASSESFTPVKKKPEGILTALNEGEGKWQTGFLNTEKGITSDSIDMADINGDGKMDILVAPATSGDDKEIFLWAGDGKGGFEPKRTAGAFKDSVASYVKSGDVDGDGKKEIFFLVSGIGKDASIVLNAFKWSGEGFMPFESPGLKDRPMIFDLLDINGDGKDELIIISAGLEIFGYESGIWRTIAKKALKPSETEGVYGIKTFMQADGYPVVVYNMGRENPEGKGIRAFRLR